MPCGTCGKVKKAATTGLHVAQGFTSLAVEKTTGQEVMKYEKTDSRIKICRTCEFNRWRNNNRSLWCKLCGCFVPAKARVKDEKCPKGFWETVDGD